MPARKSPRKSATEKPRAIKKVAEAVEIPKCAVVISKEPGMPGLACPEDAEFVVQLTDPDDPERLRITGVLLLCSRHMEKFESGASVLAIDTQGNLILSRSDGTMGVGADAS